jgi:hypothetical protein
VRAVRRARQCEAQAQVQHVHVQQQTSGAKDCYFSRDLSVGDEGADVEILQAEVLGMSQVDGKFGQDTYERLAEWQSNSGLEATGYFGPSSRTKIGEMVESSIGAKQSAEFICTVNRQMSIATSHINSNMMPPGVSSLWVGLAVGCAGLRKGLESKLRKSRGGKLPKRFSRGERSASNTTTGGTTTAASASATAEQATSLDEECTSVAEWASRQRQRNQRSGSTKQANKAQAGTTAKRLQRRMPYYDLKPSADAQAKIGRARQKQKQQKQMAKNQDKTLLKTIVNADGTKTFVLQSKPKRPPQPVTKRVERGIDRRSEEESPVKTITQQQQAQVATIHEVAGESGKLVGDGSSQKKALLTCSSTPKVKKNKIVKYTRPSSVEKTISQSVKSAVFESRNLTKWLEPSTKTKSALDVDTEKALASHLSKQISTSYALEDKTLDSISTTQATRAGPPKDRNANQSKEAAVPALAAAVGAAAVGTTLGAEDALVGAITPVADVSAALYPLLFQPAFELVGIAATSTIFFKYFLQKEDRDNTMKTLVHLGKRVGVVTEEAAAPKHLIEGPSYLSKKMLPEAKKEKLPARSREMVPKLPKQLLQWNSQQEDLQTHETSVIAKLMQKRSPIERTEEVADASLQDNNNGPTVLSKNDDSSSRPKLDQGAVLSGLQKTILSLPPSLGTNISRKAAKDQDQKEPSYGETRDQVQGTAASPILPRFGSGGGMDAKDSSSRQTTPEEDAEEELERERHHGAAENNSTPMTSSNSPSSGVLDQRATSRAVNPALDRDRARSHLATGTAVEKEEEKQQGRPLWEALTEIFKQKRKQPPTDPETTIVRFSVEYVTKVGQNLKLIGDHEALGNWSKSRAVSMSWSSGHLWTAEVELPCRKTYFYKYAIEEVGGRLTWQQGNNRLLTIPDSGTAGAGPLIEAHDNWSGDPLNSSVMQTTVDGAVSWPESAEERLQTFVSENSDLEIDIDQELMESLIAKNMTVKEFKDELLEILERLRDNEKESS